MLRYRGKNGGTLKGWVIVIGLVPDTTHAWHFHGRVKGQAKAPGNCKTQKDPVILAMDDLTSDARGVAIVRVNLKRIGKNPLLKGNYLNIHESASTDGVGPGNRLRDDQEGDRLGDPHCVGAGSFRSGPHIHCYVLTMLPAAGSVGGGTAAGIVCSRSPRSCVLA